MYAAAGRFYSHPLRIYKSGRLAQCWHVGGLNHGCVVRFDLAGTPRVLRLVTPVLQSAGLVRLRGQGIDGGLNGQPGMIATLFRGNGQLVVGACGEKDCAPSNMGMETIGCLARDGSSGDGVLSQEFATALAYSDDSSYGCKLDALAGGLTGGFFNLSMHAMDDEHRGDAYMGFATTRKVDYATGDPFYAELLPVITGVAPRLGSLAGGADLTISGTGFGSVSADLKITVGNATCAVTAITPEALHCRVQPLVAPINGWTENPPANPAGQAFVRQGLVSHPSQRGVRFQWRDDGTGTEHSHGGSGTMLLSDFSAPLDYELGKAGSKGYVEGWFESPVTGGVTFFLSLDAGAGATLQWSGNDTVAPVETLATTPAYTAIADYAMYDSAYASARSDYANPAVPQITVEMWLSPTWPCTRAATDPPCASTDMATWGPPTGMFLTTKINHQPTGMWQFYGLPGASNGDYVASRWRASFHAEQTGEMSFEFGGASNPSGTVLYVDGVEVLRQGGSSGSQGYVFTTANQWYDIEIQQPGILLGGSSFEVKLRYSYAGSSMAVFSLDGPLGGGQTMNSGRVWPTSQSAFTSSGAVSRRVDLVKGRRYWLGLTCTSPSVDVHPSQPDRGRCAVGARLHTDKAPRFTRFNEPTGRTHRRLAARVHLKSGCGAVTDKEMCCSALDRYNEPCVAAVTTFANGKVCMDSQWAVRYASRTEQIPGLPNAVFVMAEQATCPAKHLPSTNSARPRTRLPAKVGCHTLRDRAACCSATDGRTEAIHLDQPCVAAQVQFLNGNMCETARYVKDLDPHAAASCSEFAAPFMQSPIGESETLVHEVQKLSLAQANPARLTQVVTFDRIDCPANRSLAPDAECTGTASGTVQLTHNGKASLPIALSAASASEINYAFTSAQDTTYSGLNATILKSTAASVVWRLELTTPWFACTNQLNVRPRPQPQYYAP